MEAEINKKIMSTAYPSADFTAEVLSEGDAIVPDTKPDISEILMCEGRCSADKVEIQKGRVIFTGTASFTVLYRPENGDGVHSVTAKFPFNHIAQSEAVMPDDKALYTFKVADTKCSLINSRKLSLKADVLISVHFIYRAFRPALLGHFSAGRGGQKRDGVHKLARRIRKGGLHGFRTF